VETESVASKRQTYDLFILVLTILSLVLMVVMFLPLNDATIGLLQFYDNLICAIFLVDFSIQLHRAERKSDYFIGQRGWLDLLGSLPAGFKLFRIFRVVRVARLLREYGPRNVLRSFIKQRADNALLVVMLLVVLVLEFGSMAVLRFEQYAPGANITTAGDSLWWAFVSITTVGYCDKFPVTTGGRLSAFFVLSAGVGLFGVLSGYLANFFLSPSKKPDEPEPAPDLATSTDDTTLLAMIDELEANIASLRARIADRAGAPQPPGTSR